MKSTTFYSKPKRSAGILPAILDKVQFEKRSVSGHRFSDATKGHNLNGFSRPARPQWPSLNTLTALGGMPEGMP
jgi:hypothetical protein